MCNFKWETNDWKGLYADFSRLCRGWNDTVGRLSPTGEGNGCTSSSATLSLSISAESHLLTPALIAHKGLLPASNKHTAHARTHTCTRARGQASSHKWLKAEFSMFDRTNSHETSVDVSPRIKMPLNGPCDKCGGTKRCVHLGERTHRPRFISPEVEAQCSWAPQLMDWLTDWCTCARTLRVSTQPQCILKSYFGQLEKFHFFHSGESQWPLYSSVSG